MDRQRHRSDLRRRQPGRHARLVGRFQAVVRTRTRRRAVDAAARGLRRLAGTPRRQAGEDSHSRPPTTSRRMPTLRPRAHARRGQVARPREGRVPALGADAALLRGRGPVIRRRDLSAGRSRHGRLQPARAARRGDRHLAVELPGVDPGAQDRAGAHHRQHRRLQALVRCAAHRLSPGRGAGAERPAEGRSQLHHRSRRGRRPDAHRVAAVRAISFTGSTAPASRSTARSPSRRAPRWSWAARTR